MLIIQNPSQLHHIIDPDVHKLVTLRLSQLGSTLPSPMIIMEPGDSLSSIEKEIGFPILTNLLDVFARPLNIENSLGSIAYYVRMVCLLRNVINR